MQENLIKIDDILARLSVVDSVLKELKSELNELRSRVSSQDDDISFLLNCAYNDQH